MKLILLTKYFKRHFQIKFTCTQGRYSHFCPHGEGLWKNTAIPPPILNLVTSWGWVVKCTAWLLHPPGRDL